MRITKLNWQEPAAYTASIGALFAGLVLGYSYDPVWLGRAGSVIIVCGVLLAASRKIDILHDKSKELIAEHRKKMFPEILSEFTDADGSPISPEQAKKHEQRIYDETTNDVGALIEERRHVFKLHEVSIVVAGTLINGFGEWGLKTVLTALFCAN